MPAPPGPAAGTVVSERHWLRPVVSRERRNPMTPSSDAVLQESVTVVSLVCFAENPTRIAASGPTAPSELGPTTEVSIDVTLASRSVALTVPVPSKRSANVK